MDLNPDLVFAIIKSENQFPVDFDDAWEWIGYSTKGNAKIAFENAEFLKGIDFEVFMDFHKNPKGGRPPEKMGLTVDCFKSFAMMAGTAKGREVRRYFLNCEAKLKEILEAEARKRKERVVRAVVSGTPAPWFKRYEDEFFEEAYRISGWKRTSKGHPSCMGRFIKENIYNYFPEGVPEKLAEVNPRNEYGQRSRKHHQHLTSDFGLPILDSQKAVTLAVMRLSPSNDRVRFKSNMQKACADAVQIELPWIGEEAS